MSDPESETPLSRIELLRLAQGLGVSDADVMTRAELRAAIGAAQRPEPEPASSDQHPITWVSVARRLLARVVERGLNLPDAAALIRGDTKLSTPPKAPPPVATVTLARIYAAQGHLDRAIGTLNEVLKSDPDHELARDLRTQLELRRDELQVAQAASRTVPASAEADAEAPVSAASDPALQGPPSVAPPPFVEGPVPEPPPLVHQHATAPAVGLASAYGAPNGASVNGISLGTEPRVEPPVPAAPPVPAVSEHAAPAAVAEPALAPPASKALPPPLPSSPGLVLIETDTPIRYLYWEVAAAGLSSRFWIHVVVHTPNGRGEAERRERRFPVSRQQGALRFEGVSARAVVRARLTGDADEGRSLVVAGTVKQRASGAAGVFQSSYAPLASARPELIAERAAELLERASPVYWD